MVKTDDLEHLGIIAAADPQENKPVRLHTNPDGQTIAEIKIAYDAKGSAMTLRYLCEGGESNPVYHDLRAMKEEMEEKAPHRITQTHPELHGQKEIHSIQNKQQAAFMTELAENERFLNLRALKNDHIYEDGLREPAQKMHFHPDFKRPDTNICMHMERGQPVNNEFGLTHMIKDHRNVLVGAATYIDKAIPDGFDAHGNALNLTRIKPLNPHELRVAQNHIEDKALADAAVRNADRKTFEQRLQAEQDAKQARVTAFTEKRQIVAALQEFREYQNGLMKKQNMDIMQSQALQNLNRLKT